MPPSSSTWPRLLTHRVPSLSHLLPRRGAWIAFGVCILAGLTIRLAFRSELPTAAAFAQEGLALAGFAALWAALQPLFEQRPASPLRTLGTLIIGALGLLTVVALVRLVGADPAGAATPASIVQRQLVALVEMSFFLFLLLQLRRLVLYRRTRQSQRNWHLMLLLMMIAALTAFGRAPGRDLGTLQGLFIVPSVVLMVLNAFRLSWIIGLSVREKVGGAALSLGLLVIVTIIASTDSDFPGARLNALETYSYALDVFALQAAVFGILYSLTALLSLVFHLPTTGDVQRKSDETAALHALAHLVDQAFDAERLAKSITAAPVEAGSADIAWLALDDAPERLIKGQATAAPKVVTARGLTTEQAAQCVNLQALFDEVRRTQAPLVLHHARSDPRVGPNAAPGDDWAGAAPPAGVDLASLLVVPLLARGTFVGALFAARNVSRGFENDEASSIQAFASQAALALDHARLFEEQIEKERLERELSIARTVQERLLPHRLPEMEGLTLAAGSTPAREVGGDYYDFAPLADGRLAFIVADVSGKGTSAAFYMAEMQGLFRSLSRLKPEPTDFLGHANDALRDILEEGVFISALYGLFDPSQHTLTLARAGHCPAAFARNGATPRLVRPNGLGLGLAPTSLFREVLAEERLRLQPGDTLAFYTDGLVESRSASGEEYGYDRLLTSLRTHSGASPEALHKGLLRDLRAFTDSVAYDDDLTLVVFQWHGPPAEAAAAHSPPTAAAQPPERTVSSRTR